MKWSTSVTLRSSRSVHQSSSCGKLSWRSRICCRWNVKTFVSIIRVCNKVLISLLFTLLNIAFDIFTYDIFHMCETWSWHTYEVHLVFFSKQGVICLHSPCCSPLLPARGRYESCLLLFEEEDKNNNLLFISELPRVPSKPACSSSLSSQIHI